MKGYIEDEEFGKIYVELRRGMTSVRFTYHADGHLLMRAPLQSTVSDLLRVLRLGHQDQLAAAVTRHFVPDLYHREDAEFAHPLGVIEKHLLQFFHWQQIYPHS